jgi:hypothetical protein
MATILEQIQNKRSFDAFVNENMKNSTYKIGWDKEMDTEYEASTNWSAATADYAAAMLGTVIAENSNRPKRNMPSIGELSGTLGRIGDEWQMDNARLRTYYLMEERFRSKMKNFSEEQRKSEFAKIVKYLFNPYELAAIAPHRRITAMYYEGLSDGAVTLTKTNNQGGIVWSKAISVGIAKTKLRSTDVVWSSANLATMDVLSVLQYAEEIATGKGKVVLKHRMSKATASLVMQSTQLKNLIGLTMGNIKTNTSPVLGIDTINTYLVAVGIAPIEIVNEFGIMPDGTSVSMFKDGRVVSQCADRVAVLKITDPLEAVDPVPNKVYTSFNDNLLSQWRNDSGRFIAYEMFAFPAFTGKADVFILDVTAKEA